MRKLTGYFLSVLLACGFTALAGCGKSNIFSWAHQAGGSSNVQALSSDASTALLNKDYSKALEYYSKILESDPNNAEAIYGYSAATLADAGIDVASLVANLVTQQGSAPSVNRLAPAIASAAHAAPSSNLLPDTIISRIPTVKGALDRILTDDRLLKIIRGKADGKIAPDNPDVNLNVAFCLILRAAITVYQSGAISFGSDYSVTVNSSDITAANSAGRDLVSAYHRLQVVSVKLDLGNEAIIANIQDDVNALFDDLKADINDSRFDVDINHDYLLD